MSVDYLQFIVFFFIYFIGVDYFRKILYYDGHPESPVWQLKKKNNNITTPKISFYIFSKFAGICQSAIQVFICALHIRRQLSQFKKISKLLIYDIVTEKLNFRELYLRQVQKLC